MAFGHRWEGHRGRMGYRHRKVLPRRNRRHHFCRSRRPRACRDDSRRPIARHRTLCTSLQKAKRYVGC